MTAEAENRAVSPDELRAARITRVTLVGTVVNLLLTAGKLAAGIAGRSGAMVADAVHSASDFATDLAVLIFVRISSRPRDDTHEWGHGKYETLATVLIGLVLGGVAVGIFVRSIGQIRDVVAGEEIVRPGAIAIVAAGVSIAVKEALYWYTVLASRKLKSPMLAANAWHHRSDALSSVGTLFGIGGAYFLGPRWRVLDPVAALLVGVLIFKVSIDLIVPGLNELLERSLPKDAERQILDLVSLTPEVSDPHGLRTRRIGSCAAIEFHIRLPADMTVAESHRITMSIERRIRHRFGAGTHVTIHVEPDDKRICDSR